RFGGKALTGVVAGLVEDPRGRGPPFAEGAVAQIAVPQHVLVEQLYPTAAVACHVGIGQDTYMEVRVQVLRHADVGRNGVRGRAAAESTQYRAVAAAAVGVRLLRTRHDARPRAAGLQPATRAQSDNGDGHLDEARVEPRPDLRPAAARRTIVMGNLACHFQP